MSDIDQDFKILLNDDCDIEDHDDCECVYEALCRIEEAYRSSQEALAKQLDLNAFTAKELAKVRAERDSWEEVAGQHAADAVALRKELEAKPFQSRDLVANNKRLEAELANCQESRDRVEQLATQWGADKDILQAELKDAKKLIQDFRDGVKQNAKDTQEHFAEFKAELEAVSRERDTAREAIMAVIHSPTQLIGVGRQYLEQALEWADNLKEMWGEIDGGTGMPLHCQECGGSEHGAVLAAALRSSQEALKVAQDEMDSYSKNSLERLRQAEARAKELESESADRLFKWHEAESQYAIDVSALKAELDKMREAMEILRQGNAGLKIELNNLQADYDECYRVKEEAYLAAMDADSSQKSAFEMVGRAKETIEAVTRERDRMREALKNLGQEWLGGA